MEVLSYSHVLWADSNEEIPELQIDRSIDRTFCHNTELETSD